MEFQRCHHLFIFLLVLMNISGSLYVEAFGYICDYDYYDSCGLDGASIAVIVISVIIVISGAVILTIWYKRRARDKAKKDVEIPGADSPFPSAPNVPENPGGSTSPKIIVPTHDNPIEFEFDKLKEYADDFSEGNKLGSGGYSTVYKGKLENGEEIAVKRLTKASAEGMISQFRNEVTIVAKLQHKNLVKLIGFSTTRSERLLIFEYLKKGSLDSYIFDVDKKSQIKWDKRDKIIKGIAGGLMYLHHDSRYRIIHRDMKLSNILLDDEWNPKITDFGIARQFESDQKEDHTNNLYGTCGYMAPEASAGKISTKMDVFSFGVVILEIISGLKVLNPKEGLLSLAWREWENNSADSLIDNVLRTSGPRQEIVRCIHIGLLCVQQEPEDRPEMDKVFNMLSSPAQLLAKPNPPPFSVIRHKPNTSGMSRPNEAGLTAITEASTATSTVISTSL